MEITFKLKGRKKLTVGYDSDRGKRHTSSSTNAWRKRSVRRAPTSTYGFNSALNGVQTLLMAMAEAGVKLDTEKMRKAVRQAHIDLDEFDYE